MAPCSQSSACLSCDPIRHRGCWLINGGYVVVLVVTYWVAVIAFGVAGVSCKAFNGSESECGYWVGMVVSILVLSGCQGRVVAPRFCFLTRVA
jgi:hypothetical protein